MMTDPDPLTAVDAQRAALAERARLPWWFWVLFGVATVGLIGGPVFGHLLSPGLGNLLVLWPSILVYVLADRLVRRSRGVRLSSRTFRDYPSSRVPGVAFLVVAIVGMISVMFLVHHHLGIAIVVVAVSSALAVGFMAAMQRAMIADLRAGRVSPA